MSHKATDWAWRTPARGVQQHVLLALAERANAKTAQCTPSLGELAAKTGLGESTIREHIRALDRAGLIKVDVTQGGRRQRSTYTLLVGATFPAQSGTPQELAGLRLNTPQEPRGKKSNTPQQLAGLASETPQEPARNPPGAGGVVLRTNTRTREPGSTGDADAAPLTEDVALFDAPSKPPTAPDEKRGQIKLAQAITNSYRERVPLSRFPAVLGVVRAAVDTGHYSAENIHAAVIRLAEQGRSLTVEALRVELEGFGRRLPPGPRPAAPTFDDLRRRGAALEAARLIRALWIEPAQPPDDTTPFRQWLHARAVEFIDDHEAELRAVLADRKTG